MNHLKLRCLSGHIALRRPQLRLIHIDGGVIGVGLHGSAPNILAVSVCHLSPIDVAVLLLCHVGDGVVIVDPTHIAVAVSDLPEGLPAVGAQEPQHLLHILVLHIRGRLVLNGRQGQPLALPSHHSLVAAHIQVRSLRKHIGAEPQRQAVLVFVFVGIVHPQPQHPVAPIQPKIEQPLVVLPPVKQPRPQAHRVVFVRPRHGFDLERLGVPLLRLHRVNELVYGVAVPVHGIAVVGHINVAAVYHHLHGLFHRAADGAAVKGHGARAPDIQPGDVGGGPVYLQAAALQPDRLGEGVVSPLLRRQLQRGARLHHHFRDSAARIHQRVHRVGPRLRRQLQLQIRCHNVLQRQGAVDIGRIGFICVIGPERHIPAPSFFRKEGNAVVLLPCQLYKIRIFTVQLWRIYISCTGHLYMRPRYGHPVIRYGYGVFHSLPVGHTHAHHAVSLEVDASAPQILPAIGNIAGVETIFVLCFLPFGSGKEHIHFSAVVNIQTLAIKRLGLTEIFNGIVIFINI